MASHFSSFDANDLGFSLAHTEMYFGADMYASKPVQQQQQACMGVLSSFPIIHESPNHDAAGGAARAQTSMSDSLLTHKRQQKTSELKFKIESIGIHPEEDDDLDMCPARTRPGWPQEITPWWKPSHAQEKPPYSYATLIAHAILASKDGRLLLSDIYRWISESYPYYTLDVRNWQNSIRHNLSLNKKWFLKVDRRPTQANPGKGCYWTLVAGTEQVFLENLTQAGGHSRKHHDIGLTAELSLGRRDNCFYASPVPPTTAQSSQTKPSATQSAPTTFSNTTTFSHATMRITRPEDYENKKKPALQRPRTAAAIHTKGDLQAPTTTTAPRLSPMYATFRMANATPETMSASKKLKRRRRKHRRNVEPGSYCDDSEDSGCDSGVDLSNENVAQKRQKKTAESALATAAPAAAAAAAAAPAHDLANTELLDVNWNSGFWDVAALNGLSSNDLMPLAAPGFDPILGLPDNSFFSHNGFYADGANVTWPLQDEPSPEMTWMNTFVSESPSTYPSLLTSRYDPQPMEQGQQCLAVPPPSKLDDCLMEVLRFQQELDQSPAEGAKMQMQMPVTVDLSDDEVTATYLHFDESDDASADLMKQSFEYTSMRDFLYSTCTTSY